MNKFLKKRGKGVGSIPKIEKQKERKGKEREEKGIKVFYLIIYIIGFIL
jgi:hypothetical protein